MARTGTFFSPRARVCWWNMHSCRRISLQKLLKILKFVAYGSWRDPDCILLFQCHISPSMATILDFVGLSIFLLLALQVTSLMWCFLICYCNNGHSENKEEGGIQYKVGPPSVGNWHLPPRQLTSYIRIILVIQWNYESEWPWHIGMDRVGLWKRRSISKQAWLLQFTFHSSYT